MKKKLFIPVTLNFVTTKSKPNHVTPAEKGYTTKDLNRICVYSHTYDNESNPFYIGQGTIQRAFNFVSRNKLWKEKVKDVSKVKVSILHIDITVEESIELEKKLINEYGRIDNNTGCLVNGNDGDTSIGCKGENNYFYDKHLYGNLNGNYGNKYEQNPLSIPIIQLNIFGNIVKRWASAREAQEVGGYSSVCVSGCCLHKRYIHKGYQWIYESEYNPQNNYRYVPKKTHKRIYICYTIYGEYVKTYYDSKQLIEDGFTPKNVSQVVNGNKKKHKNYVFKDFYRLGDDVMKDFIDKGLVEIHD